MMSVCVAHVNYMYLRLLQNGKIPNDATKISDVTENQNFVAHSIRCAYLRVCICVHMWLLIYVHAFKQMQRGNKNS